MISLTDRCFRVQNLQVKKLWTWLQLGDLLPFPKGAAQPRLVEAFMLGIPCAPALMHEDREGKFTSVKNPTLEAVLSFVGGEFKIQHEGQTLSYLELPLHIRGYFWGLSLQVVITEPTCTQEVRDDVEILMGRRPEQ